MQVLCLALVIMYVGEVCHGTLLQQGQSYTLSRARQGSSLAMQAGSGQHKGHRNTKVNDLKKSSRTTLKDKGMKHKIFSEADDALHLAGGVLHNTINSSPHEQGSHARDGRDTNITDVAPVFRPPIRPPNVPRRLLQSATEYDEDKAKEHSRRHTYPPFSFHSPEGKPCQSRRGVPANTATAPPSVCDLCPCENGKNPLDPCTCVGVGGSSAGMISIYCPSSIVNLGQLRDIFHNTNFLTTHVYQFNLQGSSADGALTRDIWGDLDFKKVSINNNKITDVDNGAFIGSNDTIVTLDLANNEIKNFIAMYNDLPNLLYLSLRGNNISLIYSEDFNYPSLIDLDLSHNQINSIGYHSFAALKKLRSLDLSYNLLTSIGDERFTFIDHDYTNVLVIDLSHNKISHFSEAAFLGLRSVEIDFRSNQLHTLDEKIFSPIILDSQYFVFFHFIDNEIICDCDILWVVEDGNNLFCFDNFECTNIDESLYSLNVTDLGNCSTRIQYP